MMQPELFAGLRPLEQLTKKTQDVLIQLHDQLRMIPETSASVEGQLLLGGFPVMRPYLRRILDDFYLEVAKR